MAELFRLGISSEAKTKILPLIDSKRFLRFEEEERATLYMFAVTLCAYAKVGAASKKVKFESFVMDKSIKNGPLATMLLSYFQTQDKVEKNIDKVGKSQRKDLVNEVLNPMADTGFAMIKEMMSKPEDVVITKFLSEMDEMYSNISETYTDLGLPSFRKFNE